MKMKKAIDKLTGERQFLEQSYSKLYGKRNCSDEIDGMKRAVMKKYIWLGAALAVALAVSAANAVLTHSGGTPISRGSEISIMRPKEGGSALKIPMRLEVLQSDEESMTKSVLILVQPEETGGGEEPLEMEEEDDYAKIEKEVRKLVKTINNSKSGEKVTLPTELASGIKLIWDRPKNTRAPLVFPMFLFAVFVVYRSRYAKVKKIENDAKESVIRELPEFINKLVLLLNAGLVLTSAFDRILVRYDSSSKEVKPYFYSQLLQINRNMRETNSPLGAGLKEFAGRSGVREFMRVANIISDNIDKGAELVEKLKGESELLWLTKKKLAEEKGRLAETKLTFPLVILLLVLIMVTIAPALMEM
ncbi:MAG: type II secretion system F family protein [Clostridiales bacterium]|nr:type II secretion system F family protein [Clostridiales bacterium]